MNVKPVDYPPTFGSDEKEKYIAHLVTEKIKDMVFMPIFGTLIYGSIANMFISWYYTGGLFNFTFNCFAGVGVAVTVFSRL